MSAPLNSSNGLGSFLYSPKMPRTSTAPKINSINSDMSNPVVAADLDSEKKYLISPYDTAGAVGIALPTVDYFDFTGTSAAAQ